MPARIPSTEMVVIISVSEKPRCEAPLMERFVDTDDF
jgi:hypothetical protein